MAVKSIKCNNALHSTRHTEPKYVGLNYRCFVVKITQLFVGGAYGAVGALFTITDK